MSCKAFNSAASRLHLWEGVLCSSRSIFVIARNMHNWLLHILTLASSDVLPVTIFRILRREKVFSAKSTGRGFCLVSARGTSTIVLNQDRGNNRILI